VWVVANGLAESFLHGGGQGLGQGAFAMLIAAHADGFGDYRADIPRAPSAIVETLLYVRKLFLLGRDD
jgi:hypothetical protein